MVYPCRSISWLLLGAGCLLLNGCGDEDLATEQEALRAEVAELREALQELRNEVQTEGTQDRIADLQRRVGEYEETAGETLEGVNAAFNNQNQRISRMQRSLTELGDIIQTGQTWVTFGLGYEGHTVARTPHGSFLVELKTQEEVPGGYMLRLRIGNPTSLQVHQFRVYGNYGSPPPEWDEEEGIEYDDFIARLNTWEGSIRSFEQEIVQELKPDEWTEVDVFVPAERLADLAFVRFKMEVDRASMRRSETDGFAVIHADYKGATILRTRYGSFPLTVSRIRKEDTHYDLIIMVGNPLGMTITSANFSGQFGPKPPQLEDYPSPERYSQELVIWDRTLTPWEVKVDKDLIPYHWNEITLRIPTTERANLDYIRLNMDIKNVSLRNLE